MADQSGYWPNNNNGNTAYLYTPASVPGAAVPGTVTSTSGSDAAAGTDPTAVEDIPGAYTGVKKLNKFTQSIANDEGGTTGDPQADAALQGTGLPHFTGAQLQQAAAQVTSNPQYPQLEQTMKSMAANPQAAQQQEGALSTTATNIANSANINVWELLIIAFKGCVQDQNDQMQYDLSKLQMYSDMNTQMSQYGNVLESTQKALDAKQEAHSSQSNVQVEMDDQRDYNNFNTMDTNGVLHYQQDATQAGNSYVGTPQQLEFQGAVGNGGYKFQVPNTNPPMTFTGYGTDQASAQLNAWNQLQDHTQQQDGGNSNQGIKANMVSAQTLNLKVQLYTQQMDQLQKLITKWQNQYQSDSETKNQLIATVTSILKNMYDMQSNGTRNLSM